MNNVNAENVTIEQSSRLRDNCSESKMKIRDGQNKMRAVFNNGKTVDCAVFDLPIVGGTSYVLVGFLPTTACNERVWQKVETSQMLPIKDADANYLYPYTIKIPATLGELWKALYGDVRPFVHTEGGGVRFVAAGNTQTTVSRRAA